jgi:hypothetical protein
VLEQFRIVDDGDPASAAAGGTLDDRVADLLGFLAGVLERRDRFHRADLERGLHDVGHVQVASPAGSGPMQTDSPACDTKPASASTVE